MNLPHRSNRLGIIVGPADFLQNPVIIALDTQADPVKAFAAQTAQKLARLMGRQIRKKHRQPQGRLTGNGCQGLQTGVQGHLGKLRQKEGHQIAEGGQHGDQLFVGGGSLQVQLIQPKIIVCLGRIAAKRILDPEYRITRQHGQWVERGGIWMTAIYHPSALLRDLSKRPETFEDLLSIREKIRELRAKVN